MQTQLASQLQKIRLDGADVADLSSILFSPRDASRINLQSIYSMARNGIMELSRIDGRLSRFEDSLFGSKLLSTNRFQITSKENEEISELIRDYLYSVSPYLLLKCVQKTLEYLIRRFSIHKFNAEDFFLAVLPYHESPLFPRIYRILDMNSHLFDFLNEVKKKETPIVRATLSMQCLKDFGFLTFVLESYRRLNEHHAIPVQHLTLLCAMVVDMARNGTFKEDYVRALVSFASMGLSSTNPELQATGLLILSQIAINVSLSDEVITACLNNSLRVENINMTQLVECILILLRNNPNYQLPLDTAQMFLQNETLQLSLQNLAKKTSIFPITTALVDAQVTLLIGSDQYIPQLRTLCQCIQEKEVNNYLQMYLQHLSQCLNSKTPSSDETNNVEKVLLVLSSEFSGPFDNLLSAIPTNDPLKSIASRLFYGSSHMLLSSGQTLFLSVDSHEYSVRKEVCSLLKQQLEKVNEETKEGDRQFIKNSLVSLLGDDFMDLTLEVFEIPLEQLLRVFSDSELVGVILDVMRHEKIICHMSDKPVQAVIKAGFSLLKELPVKTVFAEKSVEMICLFYQYFLECGKSIRKAVLKVMKTCDSPFTKKLGSFHKQTQEEQTTLLASKLSHQFEKGDDNFYMTCRQLLHSPKSVAVFFTYVLLHLVCENRSSENSKKLASLLCDFAMSVLGDMSPAEAGREKVDESAIKTLPPAVKSTKDYISLLLHTLYVCSTVLPWDVSDLASRFDTILSYSAHPISVLCFCFRSFVPQKPFIMVLANLVSATVWTESQAAYISLLACSDESNIILHSLNKLLNYVTEQKEISNDVFKSVLLAVVIHLRNSTLAIRSTVFMILDALRSRVPHEAAIPVVSTGMESPTPDEGQTQSILLQLVNYLLSIRSEVRDDVNFFTIRLNVLFTSPKPKIEPASLSSVLLPLILSAKSLRQRVDYLRLFEKMPYHPAAEKEVLQVCQDTFHIFKEAHGLVSPLLVDQWHYVVPMFFAAMAQTFTHQQEFRNTLYEFMSTPLTVESSNGRMAPLTDVLHNVGKEIFTVMNTPEKLSLLRALFSVVPNHPNVDAVDVYNSINELDLSIALLNEEVKSLTDSSLDDFQSVKLMTVFVEVVTRNEKLSSDPQIIDPLVGILNRLIYIVKRYTLTRESMASAIKHANREMEVESASTSDVRPIMSDMLSIFYPIQILLECLYSVVSTTASNVRVTSEQTLQAADPSQPPSKRVRRNSISISREVAIPPQVIVDVINLNLTAQINKTCLQLLTVLASTHSEEMDRHLFSCFDVLTLKVIQSQDEEAFNVIISVLTYCLPQFTKQIQILRIYKIFLSCVLYLPYSQSVQLLNTLIEHSSIRYLGHIIAYLLLLNNGYKIYDLHGSSGEMEEENETSNRIETSAVASSSINHFISSMFLGLSLLPQIQALSVLCCFAEIITEFEQKEKEKEGRMRELTQGLVRSLPDTLWKSNALNSIHIGQLVLNFVRDIVSNSTFISSVASAEKDMDKIQQFFIQIIENLLMVLQNESGSRDLIGVQSRGRQKTESELEAIHGYHELEGCVYDCVTVFAEVMTVSSLLTVLSVLLKHEDSGIRKRALVMLNKKINDNIGLLSQEEKADFLRFVDNLLEIINDGNEQSANKQTAMLSLHILIQYFGSDYPKAFDKAVLSIVSIVMQTGVTIPAMQALKGSAYIALSVCCSQLGIHMLPYLPRFLPSLLTELDAAGVKCVSLQEEIIALGEKGDSHELEERQAQLDEVQVLVQSLIATLNSVVTYQGSLLATYLNQILQLVIRPVFIASDKQVVRGAVSVLLDLLSEKIEARLLLPAVYSSFKELSSRAACSYSGLFSVVESLFNRMEENQVGNFYERAWSFCVSGMELRATWEDGDEADEVEQAVVKALIAITLKLNENQMNPLFVKTVNWMQEKSLVQGETSGEDSLPSPARAIPFFSLVVELSNTLKSIFTSYFGQFFSTMTDLLTAFNKNCRKEKESSPDQLVSYKLIKLVVLSLYRCFLYDSDGWMDEAKFKLVASPLAKCLGSYFIPNYATEYTKFMNNYVVPTLIQLVVSTSGHDDWWQQFNHEVLVQSRSPVKDVKLAAIHVIRECFERMSQEYLPLLPDVIPFLSDLLEDEDAEVEKAAQDLRVQLESISGEELTNYLTI